jgi:peptidyl-prolyl cis-trans isomerase A (cyclophilin A)
MTRALGFFALFFCSSLSLGSAPAADKEGGTGKWMKMAQDGKDLYATLKTNEGDIVVHLYSKDAPKTVANFVGLATGEKEWTDPKTHQKTHRPLYDGTIFHRVIPNFMIQGGDPLGTGIGDPGYRFEDEFKSGLKFDKLGLLAMANSGPGTNGSQFFITVAKTPWLNNKHTIFGEVISGYDVVEKISTLPTGQANRPSKEVVVIKVVVTDKAPKSGKSPQKPG